MWFSPTSGHWWVDITHVFEATLLKNYSLFKFSQGSIYTPMCHITLIMKIFFSSWRYPGSISINGILIVNIFILESHDINRTIFQTQERRRVLHNLCKNKMNPYRRCATNPYFLGHTSLKSPGWWGAPESAVIIECEGWRRHSSVAS